MNRTCLPIIFVLLLSASFSGFAQTKTITNADLEKYRQKRLLAEKELRENYEKLGFPSPQELARQNERSRRELLELANMLENADSRRSAASGGSYSGDGNVGYGYPNPAFVDYGDAYAPVFYNGYFYRYPRYYGRYFYGRRATRKRPRRFRSFFRAFRRHSNFPIRRRIGSPRRPGRKGGIRVRRRR